jgi:hypothetical protein
MKKIVYVPDHMCYNEIMDLRSDLVSFGIDPLFVSDDVRIDDLDRPRKVKKKRGRYKRSRHWGNGTLQTRFLAREIEWMVDKIIYP